MNNYKEVNSPEADRLVAEAAARGELPHIGHDNYRIFGLKQRQKRTRGGNWATHWSRGETTSGGITNPAVRFAIATDLLASDGQTWPSNWVLDIQCGISPGRESKVLAYARKFDSERVDKGFDLLSAVTGSKSPVVVRCHCCGKEREHAIAGTLISPRCNPNRCFARDSTSRQRANATRSEKVRQQYVAEFAALGHQMLDEWQGTRNPVRIQCGRCGGVHVQRPENLLSFGPSCQSTYRKPFANGADAAPIGRMGGLITGPINGSATDAPWRVLTGQQERENSATWLYLFQTIQAEVRNFGIAFDVDERAKGHHPDNVVALLGKRQYPDRDSAVLIESAFKHRFACTDVPPGLEGRGNTTEYTLVGDSDFWPIIEELEDTLVEVGPVDFVQDYCHPMQYQRAVEVGILPQYLQQSA